MTILWRHKSKIFYDQDDDDDTVAIGHWSGPSNQSRIVWYRSMDLQTSTPVYPKGEGATKATLSTHEKHMKIPKIFRLFQDGDGEGCKRRRLII